MAADAGVGAEAVRSAIGDNTVTATHELQLLVSLVSAIVPVFVAELLSAQARIYIVPWEAKVKDLETTVLVPAPRAVELGETR